MAVAQCFIVRRSNFFNTAGLAAEPIVDADFIAVANHTNLQVGTRTTKAKLIGPYICELQAIRLASSVVIIAAPILPEIFTEDIGVITVIVCGVIIAFTTIEHIIVGITGKVVVAHAPSSAS